MERKFSGEKYVPSNKSVVSSVDRFSFLWLLAELPDKSKRLSVFPVKYQRVNILELKGQNALCFYLPLPF